MAAELQVPLAVAASEEPGVSQAEETVTLAPSISEVALGYVSEGLLGRHGRSMPREVNFEEPGC